MFTKYLFAALLLFGAQISHALGYHKEAPQLQSPIHRQVADGLSMRQMVPTSMLVYNDHYVKDSERLMITGSLFCVAGGLLFLAAALSNSGSGHNSLDLTVPLMVLVGIGFSVTGLVFIIKGSQGTNNTPRNTQFH